MPQLRWQCPGSIGKGHQAGPHQPVTVGPAQQVDIAIRQLHRENQVLRQEREILKVVHGRGRSHSADENAAVVRPTSLAAGALSPQKVGRGSLGHPVGVRYFGHSGSLRIFMDQATEPISSHDSPRCHGDG